jgi:hypothetical protein
VCLFAHYFHSFLATFASHEQGLAKASRIPIPTAVFTSFRTVCRIRLSDVDNTT